MAGEMNGPFLSFFHCVWMEYILEKMSPGDLWPFVIVSFSPSRSLAPLFHAACLIQKDDDDDDENKGRCSVNDATTAAAGLAGLGRKADIM